MKWNASFPLTDNKAFCVSFSPVHCAAVVQKVRLLSEKHKKNREKHTAQLSCSILPPRLPLSSPLSLPNHSRRIRFDTTSRAPHKVEIIPDVSIVHPPLLFSLRRALPVLFADKICHPIQGPADPTSKNVHSSLPPPEGD